MKPAGELCADSEIIGNLEECKSAIAEIGNRGVDFTFLYVGSWDHTPKGCINDKYYNLVSFNTNDGGAAHHGIQPICKKGKLI